MAVATKIIRVANPRRRGKFRLRTARRRASKGRRRMTAKQIKFFGTARQRAGLKASRKRKRTVKASSRTSRVRRRKSNPKVKVVYITKRSNSGRKRRSTHRRKSNPGLIVTLGSINPRKRRKTSVARKHRRSTRRRRVSNVRRHRVTRRRRASNPRRRRRVTVAAAPRRRRRSRRHVAHRRVNRRRRNPSVFGRSGSKDLLKMGAGVLAGVAVTKMIPKYVPASIASSIGSGNVMAVVISAVSAWITGFALSKIDPEFGQAAMLGGFAQTMSVALNAFVPTVGTQFSLGDLVNGNFVVPQNPIRSGGYAAISAPAARGMAAYGSAY